MTKEIETKLGIAIVLGVAFILMGASLVVHSIFLNEQLANPCTVTISSQNFEEAVITNSFSEVKQFKDKNEFADYIQRGSNISSGGYGAGEVVALEKTSAPAASGVSEDSSSQRVSETNVQVVGIDEPDVLKTDGKEIYFSSGRSWPILRDLGMEKVSSSYYGSGLTRLIKGFPVDSLGVDSKIEESGDLLLSKNRLVVFDYQGIYGYDVSNPVSPKKDWTIKLGTQSQVVTSRLYNNKLYLITRTSINTVNPCPIVPYTKNEVPLNVFCVEVYRPDSLVSVDSTFTVSVVNPSTGETEEKVSFVGSSGSSVVYVSQNAVYITYLLNQDNVAFSYNFLKERASDIVPQAVISRLEKLISYDLSSYAREVELNQIFQSYVYSLGDDERLQVTNELSNRMNDYYKAHLRDLQKTGVVKINLSDFSDLKTNSFSGQLLNQFSLDEYENNLRVASTISPWWYLAGLSASSESVSDVSVFNGNMQLIGKITGLGIDERIYSARFIEEKGYVVTFKQTDPFYVIDLTDPNRPYLAGELKIPGYSSYLHPISKTRILGIGQEGSKVKISLFDVSNPSSPKEIAKYSLDEYWSEVLSNHHAFLMDQDHGIFFLPGSKGGYVFSYLNDSLKLVKAVSGSSFKRALYIDDYLYIVGDEGITVLNEKTWEKIKDFSF